LPLENLALLRCATATLASSDSLRSTAVIGATCNLSPESGKDTELSLALLTSQVALERISDWRLDAIFLSQAS